MPGAPLLVLRSPEGSLPILAVLVDRLEELGEVVPVPGAPPAIAGVTEVRSVVLTLLEPSALPGWEPSPAPGGLPGPGLPAAVLRLAEPWRHLGIRVPPGSRVERAEGPRPGVLTPRRLATALGRIAAGHGAAP